MKQYIKPVREAIANHYNISINRVKYNFFSNHEGDWLGFTITPRKKEHYKLLHDFDDLMVRNRIIKRVIWPGGYFYFRLNEDFEELIHMLNLDEVSFELYMEMI